MSRASPPRRSGDTNAAAPRPTPARLAEVIGQPGLTRLLARLVLRGRLPHAVLLEGLPGCGRRTTAIALAGALLCQQRSDGDACGACDSCRQVAQGTHPDLVLVPRDGEDEEFDRKPTDGVRALVEQRVWESPLLGDRRVFIVPDIERFNGTSIAATNALLKALEEPPAGVFFVITTQSAAQVLPTIRSRTQLYRLLPLPAAELARVLTRGGVDPQDAARRAAAGGGSHRGLWSDDDVAVPLDELLALCRGGLSAEGVSAVVAHLPDRAPAEETGRTLAAEQRRVCRLWLIAFQQRLRRDLPGPGGNEAAGYIERTNAALRDLALNFQPRLVIEALAARAV